MIVTTHTIVKSAQKTLTKKVQLSSTDSNADSTIAGLRATVISYRERRKHE